MKGFKGIFYCVSTLIGFFLWNLVYKGYAFWFKHFITNFQWIFSFLQIYFFVFVLHFPCLRPRGLKETLGRVSAWFLFLQRLWNFKRVFTMPEGAANFPLCNNFSFIGYAFGRRKILVWNFSILYFKAVFQMYLFFPCVYL